MRPLDINPAKLPFLFAAELRQCKVQAGETLALVTDNSTPAEFVQAAFAAADALGAFAYELKVNTIYSTTRSGSEALGQTRGTLELLEKANLILIFHVALGSQWLGRVLKAGARALLIIDTPYELERMMPVAGLKEALEYSASLVARSKSLHVTSKAGTDFHCTLGQSVASVQYGAADEPGRVDSWGGGHFATYPNPGSAHGVIVAQPGDSWIFPYVRYVEAPVEIHVREGRITHLEGATDAVLIRQYMERNREWEGDDRPFHVSHLGWGLHPNATYDQIAVHGNDIKRIASMGRCWPGSFLFSTGPNAILPEFRDDALVNDTKAHIDLPLFGCTVTLDGHTVIRDGVIVDPKMIVKPTYPVPLCP